MNKVNCPYLGLKDDPTTALDFPSPGNFCHHAMPVAQVKGNYQQQYCLTTEHTSCPIYLAAHPIPLPASIGYAENRPMLSRRTLAILGIPVLLAGSTVLVMAWNAVNARSRQSNLIADTGGALSTPAAWALLNTKPANTPAASPTATATTEPTPTTCPMPSGWVPYTVNPTDSLYRLSVIYGVSVEQLQQVNCMGDKTMILPGQVIYVPFNPTDTPTPTATPTPVPPLPTNPPANSNNDHASVASTSTPVPPTPRRPTPVPPTTQPTNPPEHINPGNPPENPPKAKPTPKPKPNPGGNGNRGNGRGNGHGNGKGKGH